MDSTIHTLGNFWCFIWTPTHSFACIWWFVKVFSIYRKIFFITRSAMCSFRIALYSFSHFIYIVKIGITMFYAQKPGISYTKKWCLNCQKWHLSFVKLTPGPSLFLTIIQLCILHFCYWKSKQITLLFYEAIFSSWNFETFFGWKLFYLSFLFTLAMCLFHITGLTFSIDLKLK